MDTVAPARAQRRGRSAARPKAAARGATVKTKAAPKKTAKRAQAERVVTAKTTAMLSFRMDAGTRDLVDRAAIATGQNRTDFMVTTLREKATEVLLNQRLFSLSDDAWTAFTESLDNPPLPNAKLKALLAREPIWDRQ
jgi:uncharacterized protein (DUF1778 family)